MKPETWNDKLYFYGLILLAVSIPLSPFMMSIAQFLLLFNWLIEGKIKAKVNSFFHNKIALTVSSLYLLHIIGLIYTTDFDYAVKDLRTKIPLLLLPLIISTSKTIEVKQFHRILYFFVLSVLAGTLISWYYILTKNLVDIREAFPYISHIRFSLCMCLGIFICAYRLGLGLRPGLEEFQVSSFKFQVKIWNSGLLGSMIIALFLLVSLIKFQSVTGLSIVFIIFILYSVYLFISPRFKVQSPKSEKLLNHKEALSSAQRDTKESPQSTKSLIPFKIIILSVDCVILLFTSYFIFHVYKDVYQLPATSYQLPVLTSHGNRYDSLKPEAGSWKLETENGNYVKVYICEKELRDSWNKRSSYKFDSLDRKGQLLKETLIRYMTSKGLRKDEDGIGLLTERDVRAIESGVANYYYITRSGIYSRIHQIIWEYKTWHETGYLNAFSVVQRYDFWRASSQIIMQHFWIGVGTGNMNIAFKKQYDQMHTTLAPNNRWRSHNQYLSIFVAFGLIGFIWFLFTLFYPIVKTLHATSLLYFAFFLIIILSMLTEDTIESQAGVTFFAFFNSLLLFIPD